MSISLQWLAPRFPDLANLAKLSEGGQKEVFSASHKTDGQVVLKIIHPNQNTDHITRELLAVQQVQSSRVPRILDSGEITTPLGKCQWVREQRIGGKTVRACLAKGSFADTDLIRLGLHVLEALVRAEAVQIVHRDIKPDNIMQDDQRAYWLLDFGIARHLDLSSLTASASHFGKFTLGYAPPEQVRNLKREIDSRSDLFGLGVTLYECATGTNPFRAGATSELEILKRVERLPLPELSPKCHSASELKDLIAAMTQKRREHRPFTAKEAHDWMSEIATCNGVS